MGTIKDLVDLITKLSESVKDRKFAAELREIQRMIGTIQSEQAELREQRIRLMTENEELKKKISSLQDEISKKKEVPAKDFEKLPEESERMLVFIASAKSEVTQDDAINHCHLPKAKGDYFFDQLRFGDGSRIH